MDKWIPPSPAAPNVSRRKELGRSQAWPGDLSPGTIAFPPSFFFLSFLSAREALNVMVHPLPPSHQHQHSAVPPAPRTATYFPLHMLMLQSHSAVGGFVTGGGLCALRGSCMHFTKLTPQWLPDLPLFYSLLPSLIYFSISFPTTYWTTEQKEELWYCCLFSRLSAVKCGGFLFPLCVFWVACAQQVADGFNALG